MIQCANPKASYLKYQPEIDAAIAAVLTSGRYTLGPQVTAFEQEFAAYIGVAEAVGVGTGTDALLLGLRACGIGPGDEVITVSHTAVATVAAIVATGATPVFVDIEPDYLTIDPGAVNLAITPKTKAVVPVHLYGHPAAVAVLQKICADHDLYLIEDCAQAHGARAGSAMVGSWGDVACFSFYPTKNLGAIGDGGMVVTNSSTIAARVRRLREYGWQERYVSHEVGWNSRLDEIQAAILRVKLKYLANDIARRQALAARYLELLPSSALILPKQRLGDTSAYHLFVVQLAERHTFQQFLFERGVGTLVHYPVPVHLQPAYRTIGRVCGNLPFTVRSANHVVSLPLYPELTMEQQDTVIAAVHEFAQQAVQINASLP